MRPQHAGVVRGLDLIETATAARLERLRTDLEQRVRRGIDVAPPLLRAGVLIPVFLGSDGAEVLFTRRTDTVLTHKGQISFPGGQREERDETAVHTALRESEEEIGLDASRVTVLGQLDDVYTAVSHFVVTAVVGLVAGGIEDLRLAPDEVRSVFTAPVASLLEEHVHTTQTRTFEGQRYRIHYYAVGDDVIWGATGRIVYQFLKAWVQAGR